MPLVATQGEGAKVPFLVLTVVWSITSSALRAPPLVLLGKYAKLAAIPWLASLSFFGLGLAGAMAPYLTVNLRGLDPRWPFALSSLALLLAIHVDQSQTIARGDFRRSIVPYIAPVVAEGQGGWSVCAI